MPTPQVKRCSFFERSVAAHPTKRISAVCSSCSGHRSPTGLGWLKREVDRFRLTLTTAIRTGSINLSQLRQQPGRPRRWQPDSLAAVGTTTVLRTAAKPTSEFYFLGDF